MKSFNPLLLITLFFATIIGETSLALGQCINCNESTQEGDYSSAIGTNANADGYASFASGSFVNANGIISTALGSYSTANGDRSFSFGTNVEANATKSFVIGAGYSDAYPLRNLDVYTFMIGLNSNKPTFFISMSDGIDKTGRVAIGNMTEPQAKLHIYSDEDENATLFLQPSIWDIGYNAEIWLGNQNHGVNANTTEGMVYKTEVNHVFKGGDVYIEDIDKGIIMKSPDEKCWRGTLNNEGVLSFTELESCPEIVTDAPETGIIQSDKSLKVYPNPTKEFLTVEFENPSQNQLKISLVDERGIVLKLTNTKGTKTQFYTGDLKTGLYFVKVVGNGQQLVSKVIRD